MPELSVGVSAFREKAGMSQVCFIFSLFLPVDSLGSSRPPVSPSFHPHSWLSDLRRSSANIHLVLPNQLSIILS